MFLIKYVQKEMFYITVYLILESIVAKLRRIMMFLLTVLENVGKCNDDLKVSNSYLELSIVT